MKLLKHKPGLEVGLFKQRCEQKQKVKIVIMVDVELFYYQLMHIILKKHRVIKTF